MEPLRVQSKTSMKVEKEEANIAAIEKKPLPIEPEVREIGDRSSRSDEILTSGNRPILKPNDGLASSHPHDAQLFIDMYPTQDLGCAVDDLDDSLRPLTKYTEDNNFDLRGISNFISSSSPYLQRGALQLLEHAAKWQSTNFTECMSVTFGPVAKLVLDSRDIQVHCAALDTLKLYLESPHAADIVKSMMPRDVVDAVSNNLNSHEPLVQLASVELLEVAAQSEEILIIFAAAVSRIFSSLPSMSTTTQVIALRVLEICAGSNTQELVKAVADKFHYLNEFLSSPEDTVQIATLKVLEAGEGTKDPDLARAVKTILPVKRKNRSSDETDAHRAAKQVREVGSYNDPQASRSVGQENDMNVYTGNAFTQIPATIYPRTLLNNELQSMYGSTFGTHVASQPPHPRTLLNNELQSMFGNAQGAHVRWETRSTGPPNSTWHATVYIDGMNHGTASAVTKGAAQDEAALQAYNNLRRARARGY